MPDLAAARQAKSRIMDTVLNTGDARHVAAVGLGQQEGGWVVRVNLREDDNRTREKIPSEVEGVPVVVEVTGSVHAQSATGNAILQAKRAPVGRPGYVWLLLVGALLVVIAGVTTMLITLV